MLRLRFCAANPGLLGKSVAGVCLIFGIALMVSCTGKTTATVQNGMGTVNVSISDPPSCSGKTGTIAHVFVTVRSVQAHTSGSPTPDEAGWQELEE